MLQSAFRRSRILSRFRHHHDELSSHKIRRRTFQSFLVQEDPHWQDRLQKRSLRAGGTNQLRPLCHRSFASNTRTRTRTKETLFTKENLADGPPLSLGTGKLANLTKASVVAAMGDTVVLTTVATGDESNNSFQNLTVDYKQRHHGVGKIPLTTASRIDNARSTPLETLGSRAIDRALRPLVISNQTIHIHSSVQGCSKEGGNPIVASINSASAALTSQGMLQEPVAAVSLGVVVGPKVLINPSNLLEASDEPLVCELLYAGTRSKAVMAEFQYNRLGDNNNNGEDLQTSIAEEDLAQLMTLAHAALQPLLDTQDEFIQNNRKSLEEAQAPENDAISEENELRATLGLPPLPEEETTEAVEEDSVKQKAEELFEDAAEFCQSRLKDVTLALFGYKAALKSKEGDSGSTRHPTAYIHDKDEASKLLAKSTRGRREQIVQKEIERELKDWVKKEHSSDIQSTEDEEAIVSILAGMVHKNLLQKALCTTAIEYGTRADQRVGRDASDGTRTIRPLSITVPALPEIVHGSAIFARGETQVLCTATLGAPRDGIPSRDPFQPPLATPKNQPNDEAPRQAEGTAFEDLPVGSLRYLRTQEALESDLNTRKSMADREMTGDSGSLWENRRAFLQYDFPSFSTGEVPTGSGMHHNRRAIGHGALAEKAILPVLPSPHKFPYAMRITSEVTGSNGSSSMASVCGASLALMDAGVPIVTPVAGVSVGLALPDDAPKGGESDDKRQYELLLDITGTEDYFGAMDFKIAGTYVGVTALQLDVKEPIPLSVLPEALFMARAGRQAMLNEMTAQGRETVLQGLKHRPSLKDTAPRVEVVRFDPQRKRDLIGPGGAVLRQLEDRYDVSVDLTQEGQCLIFGTDKELVQKAQSTVSDLVADVIEGEVYEGTIVELKDFGAILELLRNKEGLLHVSELADDISDPQGNLGAVKKHLKEGDKIKVLCTGVDPVHGSIRLSVKALYKQQKTT